MKRLFLILFLGVVFVYGSTVEFEKAKESPKRIAPSSNDTILSFHSSIKDAKNSVVNISTTKTIKQRDAFYDMFEHPFFRDFFGRGFQVPEHQRKSSSLGSGVIISKDGYIVTNNHVVEESDEIIVSLIDNSKEFKAKVVGLDPKTDLAVIKIDAKDLQAIVFADSSYLLEGDVVFAIGNPFGVGGSVTKGIVSALNKSGMGLNQYENFIQTDASINPGNSGGALVDSRGALVGINSAILSRSGGNNGIGFAIPSNMVETIAKTLIEDGRVDRGYMGVSIGDLTSDLKEVYTNKEGALVLGTEENGPAAKAGIVRGDLIIKIDDIHIKNANELKNTVGSLLPGKKIVLTYERDNKIKTSKVTLDKMDGETNENSSGNRFIKGLFLDSLNDDLRYKYRIPQKIEGVLVTEVENDSEAEKFGFKPGDVILQVEQTVVATLEEFNKAFENIKKEKIRVWVNRGGYISPILIK
ncbi:MAG: Do family serine endopeptidase [Sulfurospirillaceae bacterium]|jgi:serine protease Do|nr:Do family serine endopeptidase [Sulfurospirillaceae bacterium]MCK9545590.1 Do family serine endopeptidase [Sulfurospirillaceae bacterium]MDY0238134.1 Do family serine endopeptidase [Campylobacterales bacterium]NLM98482.1 Do family serine endopeptidase [Campylobacteraceae bacterium]